MSRSRKNRDGISKDKIHTKLYRLIIKNRTTRTQGNTKVSVKKRMMVIKKYLEDEFICLSSQSVQERRREREIKVSRKSQGRDRRETCWATSLASLFSIIWGSNVEVSVTPITIFCSIIIIISLPDLFVFFKIFFKKKETTDQDEVYGWRWSLKCRLHLLDYELILWA